MSSDLKKVKNTVGKLKLSPTSELELPTEINFLITLFFSILTRQANGAMDKKKLPLVVNPIAGKLE